VTDECLPSSRSSGVNKTDLNFKGCASWQRYCDKESKAELIPESEDTISLKENEVSVMLMRIT
jgi:hypothetical protein